MNCAYCGNYVAPNTKFCSACGAPQPEQPVQPQQPYQQQPYQQQPYQQQPYQQQPYQQQPYQQQPYQQQPYQQQPYQQPYQAAPVYENLTWQQFYDRYASKKTKGFVTWMAVICFFTMVISFVLLFALEYTIAIMDIIVYASMGVLLLSTKHWLFAMLPTIYSAIFTVIGMANDGTASGIVALVVGVMCTSLLQKVQKAYTKYRDERVIPEGEL